MQAKYPYTLKKKREKEVLHSCNPNTRRQEWKDSGGYTVKPYLGAGGKYPLAFSNTEMKLLQGLFSLQDSGDGF